MTVAELIKRLRDMPPEWKVYATKAGGSLEVWNELGPQYGFVFTYDKPTKFLTRRMR